MAVKLKGKGNKITMIALVVAVSIMALVLVGVIVKMNRNEKTKDVGGWVNYEIGLLDDTGAEVKGTTAIRTKGYVKTDGLTCDLAEKPNVSYKLYFYDGDKKFVSKTETLTADYDGSAIPETAEYARIVITPTNDPEVSWTEIGGYEKELTVTVKK